MNTKKVIITGAPGTGKSTLINSLIEKDYYCFEEISRALILDAQKQGIEQLFLANPLKFSELLLKGRQEQFESANHSEANLIFFDRGIPDILAYLDYAKIEYPNHFIDVCKSSKYDVVFILNPWEAIYKSDNERYENFNQAQEVHKHLVNTYNSYGYNLIKVPFSTPSSRIDFILNHLKD